jgi:hypothetical protein
MQRKNIQLKKKILNSNSQLKFDYFKDDNPELEGLEPAKKELKDEGGHKRCTFTVHDERFPTTDKFFRPSGYNKNINKVDYR